MASSCISVLIWTALVTFDGVGCVLISTGWAAIVNASLEDSVDIDEVSGERAGIGISLIWDYKVKIRISNKAGHVKSFIREIDGAAGSTSDYSFSSGEFVRIEFEDMDSIQEIGRSIVWNYELFDSVYVEVDSVPSSEEVGVGQIGCVISLFVYGYQHYLNFADEVAFDCYDEEVVVFCEDRSPCQSQGSWRSWNGEGAWPESWSWLIGFSVVWRFKDGWVKVSLIGGAGKGNSDGEGFSNIYVSEWEDVVFLRAGGSVPQSFSEGGEIVDSE